MVTAMHASVCLLYIYIYMIYIHLFMTIHVTLSQLSKGRKVRICPEATSG